MEAVLNYNLKAIHNLKVVNSTFKFAVLNYNLKAIHNL